MVEGTALVKKGEEQSLASFKSEWSWNGHLKVILQINQAFTQFKLEAMCSKSLRLHCS